MREMSPELTEFFETGEGTQYAQGLQILTFAMLLGVTLFLMVVIVVIRPPEELTAESLAAAEEQARLFSMINVALCFGGFLASMVLPRFMRRPDSASAPASGTESLRPFLAAFRTGHILCAALLEGPALFGVVAVFLARNGGVLAEHPVYWGNLVTIVPFYLWAAVNWPNRSRITKRVAALQAGSWRG